MTEPSTPPPGPWITLSQVVGWHRKDGRLAEVQCPDPRCVMVPLVAGVIAEHELVGRRCVWSGVRVVNSFVSEPGQ